MKSWVFGTAIAIVSFFFGELTPYFGAGQVDNRLINIVWNPLYGFGFWFVTDMLGLHVRSGPAGIFGVILWPVMLFAGVLVLARLSCKLSPTWRITLASIFVATLLANARVRQFSQPPLKHLPCITFYLNEVY